MKRHASDEDLASFAEGLLRPRKRAKISVHLASCARCTHSSQRLSAVSAMLADVSYPPMPEHLYARIEIALASESSTRVASQPATEAGGLDLPERARSHRVRSRLPWISSPLALRLVAAAAAGVIVAGGGYEIATHAGAGSSVSGPSGQPNAATQGGAAPSAQALSLGPSLRYQHDGHAAQIRTVEATTNFVPGTFQTQALSAMRAAGADKLYSRGNVSVPSPTSASSGQMSRAAAARTLPPSQVARLTGCVDLIAAGRDVLMVEVAYFNRSPATIIVVSTSPSSARLAFAVGPACSSTSKAILFSITLPGS